MKFNHKKFFAGFKADFDDTLDQAQVDAITFLLTSFENEPRWKDVRHIAYALATTYHETAGSMQPVEEGYYLGSARRVRAFQKTLRYYPYFGRGYVQLTWETKRIPNYSKASKALGVDFVKNPELVMVKENAFKIMTLGMFEGWFTTHKLSDYIRGSACDYKSARKIINGLDKAGLIAGYARLFEKILNASATAAPVPGPEPVSIPARTPVNASPSPEDQAPPIDHPTQEPNSTETVVRAETDTGSSSASVEQTTKTFNPETIPQYIPKMKGVRNWFGSLGLGGIASTTWAAFNDLPPWAIFTLGMVTMAALIGFAFVAVKYRENLFDLVKHVIGINADPEKNNIELTSVK